MRKFKDGVQHVFEYLLIAVFLLAAYGEVTTQEPVAEGILGLLFADPIITTIYAVWFTIMAVTLAYSKWFRQKRLHKHALAAMYLTTVYTITLSLALFGFGGGAIIDDGVIGLVAAVCWLRWKLLTEYISPNQFTDEINDLRDDLPPS